MDAWVKVQLVPLTSDVKAFHVPGADIGHHLSLRIADFLSVVCQIHTQYANAVLDGITITCILSTQSLVLGGFALHSSYKSLHKPNNRFSLPYLVPF